MRVELGNVRPQEVVDGKRRDLEGGPRVSYLWVPESNVDAGYDIYTHPENHTDDLYPTDLAEVLEGANARQRRALIEAHLSHPDNVHGLPNHEAFTAVVHPLRGFWNAVSTPGTVPEWVWSDNAALQQHLADHWGVPAGKPSDLEDRYTTQYGAQSYMPGARPDPLGGVSMLHLNIGRDLQAVQQAGFGYLGTVGVATATTSNSLTGGTETGVSHVSNDCAGQWLVAMPNSSGSGSIAWGYITGNSSGTSPTYNIDRWYNPASPGGAAATTPSSTANYMVMAGGPPMMFVGLSTSTVPVVGGDTTLASEITTVGGGLIRKIAPLGHTAASATFTLTPVFTANGSDSLPVTVGKAGASSSLLSSVNNAYQTLVSPTATLSSSGDQLTITWTFTMT